MQRESFAGGQLTTGAVVFEWQREFTLWGYTGSHSVMLFPAPRATRTQGRPRDADHLVFKPVRALSIRTHYQTLTVRVASAERTEEVLGGLGDAWPEECVLELVGADATSDHIVCMAVGCHEDEGQNWEPSAFAADLSDGNTPRWRTRVLGGGPDGELSARFASLDELAAAVGGRSPARQRQRHTVPVRGDEPIVSFTDGGSQRHSALSVFITREEAEEFVRERGGRHEIDHGIRIERWVQAVPLDL